ncbi:MAG: hypothetical protein ACKOQ8_00730 [Micrococcales bacterium]
MATKISDIESVHNLIASIKNPARKRPICAVSIALSEDEPGFDVPALEEDAGEVADFYVIKSGELTYEFKALMPADTQVFGGAARAYPIDFAAHKIASPLRYPIPPTQLKKATVALVGDIWTYANAAGLVAKPAPNLKPELVTVEAIYGGDVAVLKRANGERVSLRSETVFPGIPLDRVLSKGQQLEGIFDPSNKAFAFSSQNPTVDEVVKHFGFGTVTLGLIRSTDRKTAKVALHPNLEFEVAKKEITGNERDVISDYLKVGQVYAFRLYRDPQGHVRLRCDDIDDDEPVASALSLLPGSGPWLEEGLGIVADDEPEIVDELVVSELDLPTEAEIEEELASAAEEQIAQASKEDQKLLRDNAFLIAYYRSQENVAKAKVAAANALAQRTKEEADAIANERNILARENHRLKEANRELGNEVSDLRKTKRALAQRSDRDPWSTRDQFESADEWLHEEVRRYWIDTLKPADRREFNIESVDWSFGERFFDGFTKANFDETSLRKVIRTIVELVSNRNSVPGGTESHPLTDNFKGPIRREGAAGVSATAHRMYVEENTPQAMRLHYWKLDAGGYELDGVELHDTFKMR